MPKNKSLCLPRDAVDGLEEVAVTWEDLHWGNRVWKLENVRQIIEGFLVRRKFPWTHAVVESHRSGQRLCAENAQEWGHAAFAVEQDSYWFVSPPRIRAKPLKHKYLTPDSRKQWT